MRISTFHGFPRLPKQSRPSSGSFRLGNLPFGTAVLQFIREHAAILLQTCFLCAGLIWGASFSKHADAALLERLDFLFFSSMQCRFHGSVPAVLIASAASSFLFLLACFLLGLSLWGAALIPVVPFFRGFGVPFGHLWAKRRFVSAFGHPSGRISGNDGDSLCGKRRIAFFQKSDRPFSS